MSIKGKQIIDSTITQHKLNLSDPINPTDAATKQYVDNNNSIEYTSISNLKMTAKNTTNNGDLAVNTALLQQPIAGSGVEVYVNGVQINVGNSTAGDACFFSPDGIYMRLPGNERKGDKLYWNGSAAGFDLDTNDVIDFKYIISDVNDRIITLYDGDVYIYDYTINKNLFLFNGLDGESSNIIIDGSSYEVGNDGGTFTWDIGNINNSLHAFTTVGENITITINSNNYTIILDSTTNMNFTLTLV
jgi:hypothetical protein